MSGARLWEIFKQEIQFHSRRPLLWVQIVILGFLTYGISTGHATVSSGDARVGGHKAFINSEFAISQLLIFMSCLIYVFFASVAAGMSMIRDDEAKVGELLHSTPLKPGEYVWGKFLAVFTMFVATLAVHLGLMMLFNHVLPHGENADYVGPFHLASYLRPALVFALPSLMLFCGACFGIGGLTRKPVLVFFLPIAVLMVGVFFLWEWSPVWLSWGWNRVLQFADLTGLRWLKEVWLDVDKGVEWYNVHPVGLDALVIVQRLLCVALGLGAVWLLQQRFAATLRGASAARGRSAADVPSAIPAGARRDGRKPAAAPQPAAAGAVATLATLDMRSGVPGFLNGVLEVARAELHGFLRHPGLYLFVPLILLQTLANEYQVGAFDTRLLYTSGLYAVGMMNTLTLLVCMIILFYTTESLQRERSTGFAAIAYASPLRTTALLAGKALANTVLGVSIVLACVIGSLAMLAVQGHVPLDPLPFALVWGLLLVPTFLLFTAFVSAVQAVTSNRYLTYTVGLGTMILSGWAQARGHMNWVWNWDLWSVVRWTDIAPFQYDALPLLLNRVMWLGVAVLLTVVAVRLFERRERDATRLVHALRPTSLLYALGSLAPFLVVPLVACAWLGVIVQGGYQGGTAKKQQKDYWAKNVETWRDAPTPELAGVDMALDLDPAKQALTVQGYYDVVNHTEKPMERFAVSVNPAWKDLRWTLDGESLKTENRASLHVVNLKEALAPDEKVRLGFAYEGHQPQGASKNGGSQMEFILPSSIVLTALRNPTMAPQLGYNPEVGIEENKNKSDPREWPEHWYEGKNPAGIAMAGSWFPCHLKVTVPSSMQVNATGEKVADVVRNGRRTTEWRTDQPVRIFNVIAGNWKVKAREGAAVYYDARHAYNVDEMLDALVAARRWYGEWFAPLPWKTLRVSEFAGLPTYAQAPPGNISFSENIGFLARSKPDANVAFWITAHEAAHQWWPNLAMVGDGPGTEVLSEGMAHFSTILLCEQARGLEQRIAFCRGIEDRYAQRRVKDSERALVKLDGQLPADNRIIYDKGGFALWMLHRVLGREASLAGLREYLGTFRDSRDHAALEDYLAIMRKHAPDPAAFDAFAEQWFHQVVTPEYKIDDATVAKTGTGWTVTATVRNVGTSTMPVEIAAARGERFPHEKPHAERYEDARTAITLGPKQSKTVTIACAFDPQRVVVDPDVTVLMLERQKAEVKLKTGAEKVAMR
ncbi:MAG TPA: ABC transporter permease subunit [Methylomirabilota bacterium]|nr:ABC transporter permease subunit [Methylomirabilota bacterium]